jgi:hypothetical protein
MNLREMLIEEQNLKKRTVREQDFEFGINGSETNKRKVKNLRDIIGSTTSNPIVKPTIDEAHVSSRPLDEAETKSE